MRTKLLMAQDIFQNSSRLDREFLAGFNSRVGGQNSLEQCDSVEFLRGFYRANKMINDGEIYFTKRFSHPPCNGFAFKYGTTWVCNTCQREQLDKPWWNIRVQKDGDAWCCVGEGFSDLQESDNYAFGDTRDAAIKAYCDLMLASVTP